MKKTIASRPGQQQIDIELSQEEINIRQQEEQKYWEEYNANLYKTNREASYGSIAEQLDMIYWDKIKGTTTWIDHITAVKALYPKPSTK